MSSGDLIDSIRYSTEYNRRTFDAAAAIDLPAVNIEAYSRDDYIQFRLQEELVKLGYIDVCAAAMDGYQLVMNSGSAYLGKVDIGDDGLASLGKSVFITLYTQGELIPAGITNSGRIRG